MSDLFGDRTLVSLTQSNAAVDVAKIQTTLLVSLVPTLLLETQQFARQTLRLYPRQLIILRLQHLLQHSR